MARWVIKHWKLLVSAHGRRANAGSIGGTRAALVERRCRMTPIFHFLPRACFLATLVRRLALTFTGTASSHGTVSVGRGCRLEKGEHYTGFSPVVCVRNYFTCLQLSVCMCPIRPMTSARCWRMDLALLLPPTELSFARLQFFEASPPPTPACPNLVLHTPSRYLLRGTVLTTRRRTRSTPCWPTGSSSPAPAVHPRCRGVERSSGWR